MGISGSFSSSKKFYAEEHFRYGISRSGQFHKEQVALLENHGEAYQALHLGLRDPVNGEERRFVAVCKGEKLPKTAHELAWMRFCEKTQKRPIVPSFSRRPTRRIDRSPMLSEEW